MTRFLLAATALLPFLTGTAFADTWSVEQDKSSLGFAVAQAGGQIEGQFKSFEASIDFDPANPEAAVISARIDTASAVTGNAQYDDMLAQPDYFNANTVTSATFETTSVKATGEDSYEAEGLVTIKGIQQPVTLTFTLDIEGDTAHALGEATLSRTAYEMGGSVDTNTLSDAVKVTLDLTATR